MWQNWFSGLLGLALIIIAFSGISGTTLVWTLAIMGGIIAIVGVWGASYKMNL